MIVREFIYSALRKTHVYASGEQPNEAEANDALTQLNLMLYNWSIKPNGVHKFVKESFSFTGVQEYTYGDGGDFDSERPIKILECYYGDSAIDRIVSKTTPYNWAQISDKTITGYPIVYLFNNTYPLSTITFYPVPLSTLTVFFIALKPLAQYSALTDELDLPPEYQSAIQWNLALELAPEYRGDPSNVVVLRANETLKELESYHSQNNPPAQIQTYSDGKYNGQQYNIYEGC